MNILKKGILIFFGCLLFLGSIKKLQAIESEFLDPFETELEEYFIDDDDAEIAALEAEAEAEIAPPDENTSDEPLITEGFEEYPATEPEATIIEETPSNEDVDTAEISQLEAEVTASLEEPGEEQPQEPQQGIVKLISTQKKITIPLLGTFIFDQQAAINFAAMPTAQVTATPEKSTLDLKIIQLTNPILTFSLATGLQLKTLVTAFGQGLGEALFSINFDQAGNFVDFYGELSSIQEFKPFSKIPAAQTIPGLKDISINQLSLTIDAQKTIQFLGQASILGIPSQIQIQTNTDASPLLKATPLEPLDLLKVIPLLKNTPFEHIGFSDPFFIITPQDYADPETGLTFSHGISCAGNMKLEGALFDVVRKVIPVLPHAAFVTCTISKEPAFMLSVTDKFKLFGDTTLEHIFLSIQLHQPRPPSPSFEMSLKTNIRTKLPGEKDHTLFTGEVVLPTDPTLPTVTIKGTMQGIWHNVLKLKGINMSDVALEVGAAIAPTFTPTSLGFAGTFEIGDKKVAMATKTAKTGKFVLYGKLDGEIAFSDILSLAQKTGLELPQGKIPDLSLKNVEIKIAPQATTIGKLIFPKGKTFRGELTIKGCDFLTAKAAHQKAMLDVTIDDLGIKGQGSMTEVSLANLLAITGAGPDNKKSTQDDGPSVKLVLTPQEQLFLLSGDITLLGTKSTTDIHLSPKNASFQTTLKIPPALSVKVQGNMVTNGKLPDFKISGEIEAPLNLPFGKEDLEEGTKILEENRDKVIATLKEKIKEKEQKIKERQNKMQANPAYKKLFSELDATKNKIKGIEQEIDKLESKVKGLDSEIKALERKLGLAFNNNSKQPNLFDSSLFKDTLYLTSNKPKAKDLAQKLDPLKLDLQNYKEEFPLLCWGFFKKAIRSVSRAASKATSTVKHAAKTVSKPVAAVAAAAVKKTENLAEKAGGKDALDKLKSAGYNVAKIATNPTQWDDAIKLAALKTAREAARAAAAAAKAPLKGLEATIKIQEEAIKNFDPVILKLRAEQAALIAALAKTTATLEAAIIAFKTTTLATFPAINWLTPLEVKKLALTASLQGYAKGELPTVSCHVKAFHVIDKTFTFSAKLNDLTSILKRLVLKAFLIK